MEPPPYLVSYVGPDRTPASAWSGPCPFKVRGKKYVCGVVGCGTPMVVGQDDDGVVNLWHHKCAVKGLHTFAMRAWMTKFMATTRFVVRKCPVCRTAPTRFSKPYYPYPHTRINAGSLIVDVTVHKLRFLVYFTRLRRTAHNPPLPDPSWKVYELRPTDVIPPIDVIGDTARYTVKPCSACRTVIPDPLELPVATCVQCSKPSKTVVLSKAVEIRATPWRRRFQPIQGGPTYAVEARGAKRRKTADALVWQVPDYPKTTFAVIQGSLADTEECKRCVPAVAPSPPSPVVDAAAEAAKAVQSLDPTASVPLVGCCVCEYILPRSAMRFCHKFPSVRLGHLGPLDGACYLCAACATKCSDCGALAIRELDSLCDHCYDARHPAGSSDDEDDVATRELFLN